MRVETASGEVIELGTTETAPTIGIIDFSRRVTDDFGITTVVPRGFARRMSVRLALPTDTVDATQRRLADLRATPALWVADERFASLSFQGFYKDFELDLAVPPVSYCTLTVEGLTASEPLVDGGGDPAPEGAGSTLRLLQPVPVTGGALVTSNVAEADHAEWVYGSSYALGARVITSATHRIYESAVAANTGNDPTTDPAKWIDIGPTNRWAMFDQALGTATSAVGSITVQLSAGLIDAVALLDVVASTIRVQAPGYDRTAAAGAGAITFLDMPATGGQVTVTITGMGQVSVGTLLIGRMVSLGLTEESPSAGITDFSRKEVDDFGEVTVVPRAWAKRMSVRSLLRTDAVDVVANRIAAVRARPALWIGDENLDSLTVYGFFKDFSITLGENVSVLSLSIEGLSEATQLVPLVPDTLGDLDPVAAALLAALPQDVADLEAAVGGLVSTYGSTEDAAASAAASEASRLASEAARNASQSAQAAADSARAIAVTASTNAATARDQSVAARDAAQLAQGDALASANLADARSINASGSAAAAAGSASQAAAQSVAAGQSATSASGHANNAATQAGNSSVSAGQAAASQSGAAGSAASAAANQSLSASARDAAQASAVITFPATFEQDGQFFTEDYGGFGAARGSSGGPFANVASVGRVIARNGQINLATKGMRTLEAGRTYELRYRRRATTGVARNDIAGFAVFDGAGTRIALHWTFTPGYVVADGWQTIIRTITTAELLANYPAATQIAATALISYQEGPSAGDNQVAFFAFRDITAETNAAASASASATSASAAAASQTAAGQSASAAEGSRTAAQTARSGAETARDAASTSATNASGSASAASASQSASVTARTGAETARTGAEAARDAAQGSATASASSASAASASQSASGQSATAAQGSATNAETARAQAQTAATSSSTSATNSVGSASSAASSSSVAASSRDAAHDTASLQFPPAFELDGRFFTPEYNGATLAARHPHPGPFVSVAGIGRVLQGSGQINLATRGIRQLVPGRVYECSMRSRRIDGGGPSTAYYGTKSFDKDGNAYGNDYRIINSNSAADGWFVRTFRISSDQLIAENPVATSFAVFALIDLGAPAGAQSQIASFRFDDITALAAGEVQAQAAASSASSASASQSAAGTSAASASTAANTATTQAGLAGDRATAAATSSSSAASFSSAAGASAVAAQSSATLSASISSGGLTLNPSFADWPVGQAFPTKWFYWQGQATATRAVPGYGSSPNAVELTNNVGENSGITQGYPAIRRGYYTATATVRLIAGSLTGAAVYVTQTNGPTVTASYGPPAFISLGSETDNTGSVPGAGVIGRTYTFTKLLNLTSDDANIYQINLYCMNNFPDSGLGDAAKTIRWISNTLIPATAAEIATGRIGPLEASVATLSSASAATDGRTQAHWAVSANAGGTSAAIEARAVTNPDGSGSGRVGVVAEEFSVTSVTDGVRKRVMRVFRQDVVIEGSLAAGSGVFLGTGTKWAYQLKAKDFAVSDGTVVAFGVDFGIAPPVDFSTIGLAPLASGETYNLYPDGVSGTGFTARLKIVTPGASTPVSLTADSAPGTGPTRQVARGGNAESGSGSYIIVAGGTYTGYAYNSSQPLQ